MQDKQPAGSPIGWTITVILSIVGGFIAAATWATNNGQEMSIGGFIAATVVLFLVLAVAYLASGQQQQKDKDQAETNAAIRKHLDGRDTADRR